jgi:hypothetical protein
VPYISVDETRCCDSCGGPITPKNKTGICTRTKQCRSELQRRVNGTLAEQEDAPDNCPWLSPPAYLLADEDDEASDERIYRLDANGNRIEDVDEIAVDIAVAGTRHVCLTRTERKEVIRRMIQGSWDVNEIARHCGTVRKRLDPIFRELGYEVVNPPRPNGKPGRATIRPIGERPKMITMDKPADWMVEWQPGGLGRKAREAQDA